MIGVTTCVLAAALAVTPASKASSARAAIAANYVKVQRAFVAKDIKTITAMGAPGFTTVEGGQSMNAQQSTAMLKQQMTAMKLSSMTFHIISCKVVGKKATVLQRSAMSGTMKDPSGKTHKIAGKSLSRDTWVKLPQGWRMLKMEGQKDTMTMDGKPMQMGGGGGAGGGH